MRRRLAIHQHFRLDDRHDTGLLAKRGIARQCLCVLLDSTPGRDTVGNTDHAAPFGKARTKLVIFAKPFAQSVETFGNGLIGKTGKWFCTRIDLDAGNAAISLEKFAEWSRRKE
jgi:hypothetical protein